MSFSAVSCLQGSVWCPASCLYKHSGIHISPILVHLDKGPVSSQTLTEKQHSQPRAEGYNLHRKAPNRSQFSPLSSPCQPLFLPLGAKVWHLSVCAVILSLVPTPQVRASVCLCCRPVPPTPGQSIYVLALVYSAVKTTPRPCHMRGLPGSITLTPDTILALFFLLTLCHCTSVI